MFRMRSTTVSADIIQCSLDIVIAIIIVLCDEVLAFWYLS